MVDLSTRAKFVLNSATTSRCAFTNFCKLAPVAGGASPAMTGAQTGSCRILSYLCSHLPASRIDTLCSMTQERKGMTQECKGMTQECKGVTQECKGMTQECKGMTQECKGMTQECKGMK